MVGGIATETAGDSSGFSGRGFRPPAGGGEEMRLIKDHGGNTVLEVNTHKTIWRGIVSYITNDLRDSDLRDAVSLLRKETGHFTTEQESPSFFQYRNEIYAEAKKRGIDAFRVSICSCDFPYICPFKRES